MEVHDLLAGLLILAGFVGIALVITPGLVVVVGAVVIWAIFESSWAGWLATSIAVALGVAGMTLKILYPGKRLKETGIPTRNLLIALGLGTVGFFVIPVVGMFIGFLGGIYFFEMQRVGRDQAWSSTLEGVKAIGLSIGIEFITAFLIATIWLAAAIFG